MLPGETIASGAPSTCEDCKVVLTLDVHMSPAGHYVGTYCNCGPYTRESGYYRTREKAQAALNAGGFERT